MDSTGLIHDMFLSAHGIDESISTDCSRTFIAGCRCQQCYLMETTVGVTACIQNDEEYEDVEGPSGTPLERNDFFNFFYSKFIGSYYKDNGELEYEGRVLVYSHNGIDSLYRDLEYAFLHFGWNDAVVLGQVFMAIEEGLFCADVYSPLEVNAFEMPSFTSQLDEICLPRFKPDLHDVGFAFSKRYETSVHPHLDIVRKAFVSGNIGLLNEMLKFGATMFKPQDSIYELYRAVSVISMLWKDDDKHLYLQSPSKHYFLNHLMPQLDPPARRRIYVVILGLEMLMKIRLQPEKVDYYKMCLRRVFDSIPEPHIRSSEVKSFLTELLPPEGRMMIEEITNHYMQHFPESAGKVTPRSLKHLSRVQIRHSLKEHGCFIKGMLLLDLPRSVKRYVDLDLFRCKIPTMYIYGYIEVISLNKRAYIRFPRLHPGPEVAQGCFQGLKLR